MLAAFAKRVKVLPTFRSWTVRIRRFGAVFPLGGGGGEGGGVDVVGAGVGGE